MIQNYIPYDKALHFIAGVVAAIVGLIAALLLGFEHPPVAALVTALVAGVAKEVRDFYGDGEFEAADLLATGLGGLVVALVGAIS